MSISSILDSLSDVDRERLLLLFNSGESGYITYANGKVIGVHQVTNESIIVTLQAGFWYLGDISEVHL